MKNYILIIIFVSFCKMCLSQTEWETSFGGSNFSHTDISFVNPNTGYVTGISNTTIRLLKTTNKGLNWTLINSFFVSNMYQKNSSIFFKSETIGYISYANKILKFNNGDTSTVFTFPSASRWHKIRFVDNSTGYALFSRVAESPAYLTEVIIYKTTNGGDNWFSPNQNRLFEQTRSDKYTELRDFDFSRSNPDTIHAVGFTFNGSSFQSVHIFSSNGFDNRTVRGDAVPASRFGHVNVINNNEIRILGNQGLKINYYGSTSYPLRYDFGNSNNVPELGMNFINNEVGYVSLQSGEIMKTTNGGYYWNLELNTTPVTDPFLSSKICNFGEIIYYGSATNHDFYTRKLSTNFQTYFDNQSTPSSIIFDGTQYASPDTQYLRGGYSSLSANGILNPGQSNERIFYKWSDGYFYSYHAAGYSNGFDFYFDMSGTTIANYYKTKQISEISTAIGNPAQTKSIRDVNANNVTATHTIHESMGGIFYSKSTDFGLTYQTEETVNLNDSSGTADGNKNSSLSVIGNSGSTVPITFYDGNRNVAVVWEKYNSATGKIEIKLARRILNVAQTGYEWVTFTDNIGNQYVTAFIAPSNYECKPNCFITSDQTQLQQWNTSPIIVTYLRPDGSQNKLIASVRYNSQSQDYELDNGDITDLSTVSPFNNYRIYEINFAYKKANNIVYRKEYIGIDPSIGMLHYLVELNNNISISDGYSARYRPDISLMDGLPVVSYAANYNSNAWVSYESGETDIINLHRYPIIKVHKSLSGDWGNYVIYNSTSLQDNPEREGSSTTQSYLINYKLGNGQFKKVVKVYGQPGYFCEPNTFTGTDSKLIRNSYTGSFGSNLSLLTLSQEASLYRLSRQNFAITNIIAATDQYDNFGGVVNLDTVRYSFKLGPIMIKEPDDELEEVPFGEYFDPVIPVVTPVEFNQNLRSNTFLLNETQALLVGCNASYIKDANDAVINEVKYSVDLMNKTTGLLHRVLYSDTIHAEDSVATEVLRGYYITDIPNGEDSFYVQININNDDIAEGVYSINPTYDENPAEDDNPFSYKTRVIYENESFQNPVSSIPLVYSLEQNYPNPFNPTTNLEFGISELGFVSLKIYDMLGKEVKTLVNETKPAGRYIVSFDGSNLASGVYYYRIQAGDFVETKRMLLLK